MPVRPAPAQTTPLSAPDVTPAVRGILEVPHGAPPHPGVILLCGSGGLHAGYEQVARSFADAGFVALALDYLAETGPEPSPEVTREHWPLWQALLRNAVAVLQSSPAAAGHPTATPGPCRENARRANPEPIRSIRSPNPLTVSLHCVRPLAGSVAHFHPLRRGLGLVGYSLGAFLAVSTAAALPQVGAVVDFFGGGGRGTCSLDEEARGLPPVLILHGEADHIVPVSLAYELRDAVLAHGGEVEMHIYPGVDHGFTGPWTPWYSQPEAADSFRRTIAFLSRHLQSASPSPRQWQLIRGSG